MNNHISTKRHRADVENQILTEIENGRYIITDNKPPLISVINALPKPNGGVRLINDCSRPPGQSLNDYVSWRSKVFYQSVHDATKLIQQGYYLAKVDLKSAYQSMPLHPSQFQYTGLKWKFHNDDHFTFMYDRALLFGSRLAPEIFHRLTQSIRHMMKRRGFNIVVYLNDYC